MFSHIHFFVKFLKVFEMYQVSLTNETNIVNFIAITCFWPNLIFYRIDHGKATVLEGKVTRVVILSVHHGVYQLWQPITFKPLKSF